MKSLIHKCCVCKNLPVEEFISLDHATGMQINSYYFNINGKYYFFCSPYCIKNETRIKDILGYN
jgi:hypothetical protein